jgi:hypothetical protein
MPVKSLLQGASLGRAETALAMSACDDVLRAPELADRDESISEMIARKIIQIVQSGERNPARMRTLALEALGISDLQSATETPDLSQCVKTGAQDHFTMEWYPVPGAPFDRDLELAVIDYEGTHALVFPCRRILDGWINAETRVRIDVRPTHWREWRGAAWPFSFFSTGRVIHRRQLGLFLGKKAHDRLPIRLVFHGG